MFFLNPAHRYIYNIKTPISGTLSYIRSLKLNEKSVKYFNPVSVTSQCHLLLIAYGFREKH